MQKINILETTLRDGSYAVNFSFTSQETSTLCKALEDAGFEYIEIGHGFGLGASSDRYGKALQSDEEYMIAAGSVLTKAKYGMFCIPEIARLEDVELAAKNGMGFIRIGTNVTEVEKSQFFIETAKKHGMFVAANFMKSYALTAPQFAKKVKLSEQYGVDMVYIVDSAGGMFPDDIKRYHDEIRNLSNISLGFHGHDNLSLAVSNSLEAVKLGFDFVDSSLQGLGRSAGNAVTEILVAALMKMGCPLNIDFLKMLEIGQSLVRPKISSSGKSSLDIVAGYSEFHSNYLPYIEKYASMYSINPATLIIETCKIDKVHANDEMVKNVALRILEYRDKQAFTL